MIAPCTHNLYDSRQENNGAIVQHRGDTRRRCAVTRFWLDCLVLTYGNLSKIECQATKVNLITGGQHCSSPKVPFYHFL